MCSPWLLTTPEEADAQAHLFLNALLFFSMLSTGLSSLPDTLLSRHLSDQFLSVSSLDSGDLPLSHGDY
ncbi:hypothetical protein AAMO2058_000477600 [Amorphochlora amoebiformis]